MLIFLVKMYKVIVQLIQIFVFFYKEIIKLQNIHYFIIHRLHNLFLVPLSTICYLKNFQNIKKVGLEIQVTYKRLINMISLLTNMKLTILHHILIL